MVLTTVQAKRRSIAGVLLLGLLAAAGSGCGGSSKDAASDPTRSAAGSGPSAEASAGAAISGTFSVNGRKLFMECVGQGEPTIVLEVGEGRTRVDLGTIQDAYDTQLRVCSYDRANKGQSGQAPTPRTGEGLVSDLHGLLEAAAVPGPYLLVGHSAGGLLVLEYAATHPGEVAGVVALNPVAPWRPWMAAADTLMTPAERRDEVDFLTGTNGESLDYRDVSRQLDKFPAPQAVPLHVVVSTAAQCPSTDSLCARMAPTYQSILKRLSEQWEQGRFTAVDASHDIAYDDLDAVKAAIDDVLTRAKDS
jgi:pimeloyl-ACP methyl ester carboxylesterase